jgi:hypothetical protein
VPNQSITIPINKARLLVPKAFDANGNDISALVTFSVASSDPTVASVSGNLLGPGYVVRALKVGTAQITTTAANASGSASETDTVTVSVEGPASLVITYSDPT